MDRLFLKQRMATNADERLAALHDLQRHAAGGMQYIFPWGASHQYALSNPWLKNYGVWRKKTDRDPRSYLWIQKA
jgi:hypothetical protein